jgi:hypothetical protein
MKAINVPISKLKNRLIRTPCAIQNRSARNAAVTYPPGIGARGWDNTPSSNATKALLMTETRSRTLAVFAVLLLGILIYSGIDRSTG